MDRGDASLQRLTNELFKYVPMKYVSIGFSLMLTSSMTVAGGGIRYEFSFGDSLRVEDSPVRVDLTITNDYSQPVECLTLQLIDTDSPDPLRSRVFLEPVSGQALCRSGACSGILDPRPNSALIAIAGPLAAGGSISCALDVFVEEGFQGVAVLNGMNQPITILAPGTHAVPALSAIGMTVMALAMLVAVG